MIGSQINQYKILEKIGSGGQGTVYKALDTKLNRQAVIKILPPDLTKKTASFRRFEREAQLCSQLDHPNICTIYDFSDSDGVVYIAMQYVEGKNARPGHSTPRAKAERDPEVRRADSRCAGQSARSRNDP